ncbi:unnamed protein product, partial [Mesorhabditis belari]|uniref:Charged multivesicular body protein 6 n=1 Tax=Mesorhabditis belari TaxID=2138241 RepID=A0AAF3EJT9_9BILA
MGAIFSKKSRAPTPIKNCEITEQDQAIIRLKTQRDRIKQYMKGKQKYMDKEREMAKQLIQEGRKDRALVLLKKKKYQEKIFDNLLKQLQNIEQMVNDLEFAQIQQQVVNCLSDGNEALKNMNKLFDVEEIEKIMDETKEAAEYQEEISNMLSGKLDQTDLADVEDELNALLAKEAKIDELPEVPTHDMPERERERAKEKRREKVALEA